MKKLKKLKIKIENIKNYKMRKNKLKNSNLKIKKILTKYSLHAKNKQTIVFTFFFVGYSWKRDVFNLKFLIKNLQFKMN